MKSLLLSCLFIFVHCDTEPKLWKLPEIRLPEVSELEDRIFGGSLVEDGELPYMVLVLTRILDTANEYKYSRCSGALFSENLVLAAAHCFPDASAPENNIVIAGKADLTSYMKVRRRLDWNKDVPPAKLFGAQERRGSELRIHSKYRNDNYTHDLAVLRVNVPFKLSNAVQTKNISTSGKILGLSCTISGWGETYSIKGGYRLVSAENVQVEAVGGDGCSHKTTGKFYCLLTKRVGICKGDSGSPLVCDDQIWGVASHLSSKTNRLECGDDYEQYYAQVLGEDEFFLEATVTAESLLTEVHEVGQGSLRTSSCSVIFIIILWAVCGILIII